MLLVKSLCGALPHPLTTHKKIRLFRHSMTYGSAGAAGASTTGQGLATDDGLAVIQVRNASLGGRPFL
jgi:hypothetical protein